MRKDIHPSDERCKRDRSWTLTYKRVAELIGAPPVALGGWMEPIQSYCLIHDLPPLTVRHDWVRTPVPGPDAFARAVVERPSNGIPGSAG